MKREFNELIIVSEKTKKKGGSLGAVFKLIQDMTEFEEKIQECVNAQEMLENKQQIESFLAEIDKMYEILLNMVKSGIQSLRSERSIEITEGAESPEATEEIEEVVQTETPKGLTKEVPSSELARPVAPKM